MTKLNKKITPPPPTHLPNGCISRADWDSKTMQEGASPHAQQMADSFIPAKPTAARPARDRKADMYHQGTSK